MIGVDLHAGCRAGARTSAGARRRWCPRPRGAPSRRPACPARPEPGRSRSCRRGARRAAPMTVARGSRPEHVLEHRPRALRVGCSRRARRRTPAARCSTGISGCSAASGSSPPRVHHQLVAESLGVGETQPVLRRARSRCPRRPAARAQNSSASGEPTRETMRVDHARARRARGPRPGTRRTSAPSRGGRARRA